MRVTQKIVVGTISINSVQNSSIVQIGSSGMIQSQTETMGNGNGAGGAHVPPQPQAMPSETMKGASISNVQPPTAPFAKPDITTPGTSITDLPPYVYGPPGPLGPVGGIGITRSKQHEVARSHSQQTHSAQQD